VLNQNSRYDPAAWKAATREPALCWPAVLYRLGEPAVHFGLLSESCGEQRQVTGRRTRVPNPGHLEDVVVGQEEIEERRARVAVADEDCRLDPATRRAPRFRAGAEGRSERPGTKPGERANGWRGAEESVGGALGKNRPDCVDRGVGMTRFVAVFVGQ